MCAPHGFSMEQSTGFGFINSQSTSRTLISNDGKVTSDLLAVPVAQETIGQSPIIQGPDNKQWIDIDLLDPDFLKDLRQQYDPSIRDEQSGPFGKSAAKIKAWIRRNKLGVDIRLRRKINAEQDEVTDIELVPDLVHAGHETGNGKPSFTPTPSGVTELPGSQNEINELPGSSVPHELDASEIPSRTSIDNDSVEPLPRYEPRGYGAFPVAFPVHESERSTPQERQPEAPLQRSASQSSITLTPTRGLSLRDPHNNNSGNDSAIDQKKSNDSPPVRQTIEDGNVDQSKFHNTETDQKLKQDKELVESLDTILKALKKEISQQAGETSASPATESARISQGVTGRLKVANTTTYEIETDIDPPSPRTRRIVRPTHRKTAPAPRRKTSDWNSRLGIAELRRLPAASNDELGAERDSLLRKQTLPKRLSPNAGVEEIWASLLRSQAKILGPEHSLVYQAKLCLVRSRASGHAKGFQHLVSLSKTKDKAIDTLGLIHPWVADFVDKLEALEMLTGAKSDLGDLEAEQTTVNAVPHEQNTDSRFDILETPTSQRRSPSTSNKEVSAITTSLHSRQQELSPAKESVQEAPHSAQEAPQSAQEVPHSAQEAPHYNPLWNAYYPPQTSRNESFAFPKLLFGALIKVTLDGITWVQRNYGPEQTVAPGKVRVRWTCSCGEQMHDDFIERRFGAARELEAYLNRPRVHAGGNGSPSSPSSSNDSRSFSNSSVGVPSQQTSWSSYNFSPQGSLSRYSDLKSLQTYSTLSLPQYNAPAEPPWLLTCATEDRYTPKLAHRDMAPHRVRDDKDLALSLREHYFQVNKRWWRSLRIRGLTTIEFVQFEVHQNRFADIRKCPDMPAPSNSEYDFAPSDLLPPVGSHYLLHLFRHPEDYDGELITYLRVPKKNGRLQHGVGWGINLVEGFLADRVWILVSAFFVTSSLIFAIAWLCTGHGVQGASGVAAWIVSLTVIAFGWLQAFLG